MIEDAKFINPFSRIRAEQMGDAAWKYFVPVPFKEYVNYRPLIYEGSRGSGKTMFLLCNAWEEKFKQAKASGISISNYLNDNKHIGFYHKADGRFCSSFQEKGVSEADWVGIFNTYFNVIVLLEIINFLEYVESEIKVSIEVLQSVFNKCGAILKTETPSSIIQLKDILELQLIAIEHFCNNTENIRPIGTNAGSLVEKVLKELKRENHFEITTFHVFIDEYEIFLNYQQVELNTLLKRSDSNLVYDFGVITKGILTYDTRSGHKIQPKDDFYYFTPDHLGYNNSNRYNELLFEICKKRLEITFSEMGVQFVDELTDINFYLKEFDKSVQEDLFLKKTAEINKLKQRLRSEINKYNNLYDEKEREGYFEELSNCLPSQLRIHIALLLRKDIEPKMLTEHKKTNSQKYKDWTHNLSSAVQYILCHELGVEKVYSGFKVFSALSAGVIRSFLELIEYAFDYAKNDGFDFNNPRSFTWREQTDAVLFVSRYKVSEIDSYGPHGIILGKFVKALGKVFYHLHTNANATLGENEQNHFFTDIKEIEHQYNDTYNLLRQAVMYNIIQEAESTKTKNPDEIEYMDYHLNHIYCPFFKISHWRKRKIPIKSEDVARLLSGKRQVLNDVVNRYSGTPLFDTPNLFNQ